MPEAHAESGALFEPSVLHALIGTDDREVTAQLVAVFLGTTPTTLRELVTAYGADDADEVRRQAHSLKSTAAQVGATRLAMQCIEVEHRARAYERIEPPVIARLKATYRATCEALADFAQLPLAPANAHGSTHAGEDASSALAASLAMTISTTTIPFATKEPDGDGKQRRDNPPRVLVIDDDAAFRAAVRTAVARYQYIVEEAGDGASGIARYKACMPDLVMLDLLMPGIDGFAVCATLRALDPAGAVPILVMTGLDDHAAVDRAYESGATELIAKPIRWPVLAHRIRFLIRTGQQVRALHRSEARVRAMLEAVPDTLLALSRTGTFTSYKPALGQEFDNSDNFVGRRLEERLPRDVSESARATVQKALINGRPESFDYQMTVNAEQHFFEARVVPSNGEEVIALVRDVTEQKRHEERITKLAFFDALTGLPNRVMFNDRLAQAIAVASRTHTRLAVVFVDLDRFKAVNDSLGHKAGDELLRAASERITDCLRAGDFVVSRWAGDEFVVLVTDLHATAQAEAIAARIIERFAEPFLIEKRSLFVTTSLGIAVYPEHGTDPGSLLRHADSAMYAAKNEGRNTFRYYAATMSEATSRRLDLVARLREAIQRESFFVQYQPQVDLMTGRLVGVEALVRWKDERLGIIGPDEFIGAAEDAGLIQPLGMWVLEQACRQAAAWHADGRRVNLAVNVSARQLRTPRFVQDVRAVVERTGFPVSWLELELTETVLLQDDEESLAALHALDQLGIRIALDDFGTGFSSLAYLQRFPLATLKIDRSFVGGALVDSGSAAIVRAVIAMAKSLNLEIVAEGAETIAHLQLLRELGCSVAQGYAIARPLNADAATRFLDQWSPLRLLEAPLNVS